MIKSCTKCSADYYKGYNESKKAWSDRVYCSHSCANSVNSTGATHMLGKESPFKGMKFPERSGANSTLWKRVEKECVTCECKFTVKNYRKDTTKFCTKKCSEVARDEGKTPLYKKIRKSVGYKAWIKDVFERDSFTCQSCGDMSTYLNAHHILPFSLFPTLRMSIDNGISLCGPCHKEIHSIERMNKSFLFASVEEA